MAQNLVPPTGHARCYHRGLLYTYLGTPHKDADIHCMHSFYRVSSRFVLMRDTQTAAALGKLGHPDGELNLTKAAAKHGIIQMVNLFPFWWSTFADSISIYRFQHSLHALLTRWWTPHILDKYNSSNCRSETASPCAIY